MKRTDTYPGNPSTDLFQIDKTGHPIDLAAVNDIAQEILNPATTPPGTTDVLEINMGGGSSRKDCNISILRDAMEKVRTSIPEHLKERFETILKSLQAGSTDTDDDVLAVAAVRKTWDEAIVDWASYRYLQIALKAALTVNGQEKYQEILKLGPKSILKEVAQQTMKMIEKKSYPIDCEVLEEMQDTIQVYTDGQLQKSFDSMQSTFESSTWWPIGQTTDVCVCQMTTLDLVEVLKRSEYDPVMLHMTNHKHPHSTWPQGSFAQDADLFSRSTYSAAFNPDNPKLLDQMEDGKYFLSDTSVIYTPFVQVFRLSMDKNYEIAGEEEVLGQGYFYTDVIASVAYNLSSKDPRVPKADTTEYKEGMKQKIRNIFFTALVTRHNVIVLSAYGCGGFKNDPRDVARLFAEVLQEPQFQKKFWFVAFAILGENFDIFKEVIETSIQSPFFTTSNQLETSPGSSTPKLLQSLSLKASLQGYLNRKLDKKYDHMIIKQAVDKVVSNQELAREMEEHLRTMGADFFDYRNRTGGSDIKKFFEIYALRLFTLYEGYERKDKESTSHHYAWYTIRNYLELAFESACGIKDPNIYAKDLEGGVKGVLIRRFFETEAMILKKDALIDQTSLLEMQQKTQVVFQCPIIEQESICAVSISLIEVLEIDALEQALALGFLGFKVLLLDMANPNHPGGGWRHGAPSEEEELCRRSTLLWGLSPHYNSTLKMQLDKKIFQIPEEGGIYVPNVQILLKSAREGYATLPEPRYVDILAASAYNLDLRAKRKLDFTLEQFKEKTKNKIRVVLKIALATDHNALVLSAWGCGGFKNDPSIVAECFKEVLSEIELKGRFQKVTFAILEYKNFKIFREILHGVAV